MRASFLFLLFFLVSCNQHKNQDSKNNSWSLQKDYHDFGTACIKIHTSKIPHRGFDILWQQNGEDEWVLLALSSIPLESMDQVDVVISSLDKKLISPSRVRKGGQIIQLSFDAVTFLKELQKEKAVTTIQVGPFSEEISWEERENFFQNSPYLKGYF